jgi:hypothetical protein
MIENKLSKLSVKNKLSLYHDLPYNTEDDLKLILLSYANTSCLKNDEVTIYKNLVKKLTFDCKSQDLLVKVNNNNKEFWEENNPECTNRKQWEKIALRICNKYTIEIEVIPINTICDIAFEISKKTISCDVLTSISLQQKLCDLNISVKRTKEECEADYKLLIEKYKDCNITKKEYLKLIDNNFSFEIISLIYDDNLKLEVDSKGKVSLISPIRKYKIPDELKLNDVVYSNKNLIHKVLDDYNISKNIKENILN